MQVVLVGVRVARLAALGSRTCSAIRAVFFRASWTFCVDVICAPSSSRRFAIGALLWFAWAGLRKRSACSCYVVVFFCLAAVRLLGSASLVWRCALAGSGGHTNELQNEPGRVPDEAKIVPKLSPNAPGGCKGLRRRYRVLESCLARLKNIPG